MAAGVEDDGLGVRETHRAAAAAAVFQVDPWQLVPELQVGHLEVGFHDGGGVQHSLNVM